MSPTAAAQKCAPISWKTVTTYVALTAALLGIHSTLVIPSIMHRVDEALALEIDKHDQRPHEGTVTREDLQIVLSQFANLATKDSMEAINVRLGSIERRIERIEER